MGIFDGSASTLTWSGFNSGITFKINSFSGSGVNIVGAESSSGVIFTPPTTDAVNKIVLELQRLSN